MKHLFTCCTFIACFGLMQGQIIPADGGGQTPVLPHDELSPQQYAAMYTDVQKNIALLQQQGKIVVAQEKTTATAFEFPLAWNDGFTGYNFYAISNYADHNSAYPDELLDWNCGNRSYDTDAGYNHQGIDYYLWPFSWKMMQDEQVKIVAAAPGMIVGRYDGNFDQNCAFNPGSWNAVFIRHDDGSTTWYGHMKNGSVTAKGLGETVETGEYLGLVGSSGNSTGPHLHFEVYDPDGNLIDPFAGTCNAWNAESWWADQKPYIDPEINRLQTHSAPPVFPDCPAVETTNESNVFDPGDICYFAFYAKDLSATDLCHLKITRADGSVWYEWDFYQPADYYTSSYWYWFYTIPMDVPEGMWTWSVELAGNYYEHTFLVGALPVSISEQSAFQSAFAQFQDDLLHVSFNTSIECNTRIDIIDQFGKIVYTETEQATAGNNTFSLQTQQLAKGIYYVRLLDVKTGAMRTLSVAR